MSNEKKRKIINQIEGHVMYLRGLKEQAPWVPSMTIDELAAEEIKMDFIIRKKFLELGKLIYEAETV